MKTVEREPDFALSAQPRTVQRTRRRLPLTLAALILWVALSPVPSFANVYSPYNVRLVWLYSNDIISFETLTRRWLGPPPTSDYINRLIELVEINLALTSSNNAGAAPSKPAVPADYSLVALGDLNGDGKPDLIVGGNVAGTNFGVGTPNIYTLLGNGDGTFQSAQVTPLAGADGLGAQSLALGDFNGDGRLDVAAGNPNDYTEVLLGLGDGTFAHSLVALGQQPLGLGAVDLNGDGLPDLLIGGAGGLAVFMNVASWPTF